MEEGAPSDVPGTGLEEPLWQLTMGGGGSGDEETEYPQRPGERDCDYYMRTGSCGYGDKCRFNHPPARSVAPAAALESTGDYPERVGQSVCQYFMKTGTCKFGAGCKYHHPRQGGPMHAAQLNSSGYPLRPGGKDCSYYMKTGHCKFGATCKFHHPELTGRSMAALAPGPAFFPGIQSQSTLSPGQFPSAAGWQMSNPAQLLSPVSYFPGAYGPTLFIPGVVPVSGWSPYPPSVNTGMSSPRSGQPSFQTGLAYSGHYQPASSSAGPSVSGQQENPFPERPGQPECQYYLRTGDCKFGSTCKYHHPRDQGMPKINCSLSPLGLPLRPDASACSFYMQHGHCKFGPSCKYDHPMGTFLSYSPSAPSLSNVPPASFLVGNIAVSSTAQISSTSSSQDQGHGFMPG